MSLRFSLRFLVSLLAGLVLALGTTGCGDNIGCVFTTGCSNAAGAGGIGGSGMPATLPSDGLFISNANPVVDAIFPRGADVTASSPVVIVFSESMNIDSLGGAFEVIPIIANLEQPAVPLLESVLVGDGRVLVILPAVPLTTGAYSVRISNEDMASVATDLTGQSVGAAPGSSLGSLFTVSSTTPVEPRLLMTWPQEGDMGISDSTEVVTVFDAPVLPSSVSVNSFQVRVAGIAPALNPAPEILTFLANGSTVSDSRVFTWRSENAAGPGILARAASFELTLSPSGAPMLSLDTMGTVAETTTTGSITPFATPSGAALLSAPNDGIGLRNLTLGNAEELLLQVDLDGAAVNDFVDLFLFGNNTAVGAERQLIALRRQKQLSGAGPFATLSFSLAEMDLLQSSDPADPRFADGSLSIALRLRRGAISTPLRLLDTNPVQAGLQEVVLDVTAPRVVAFDYASLFGSIDPVSEMRDAVLSGTASEALRSVEVSLTLGAVTLSNGNLPDVVASTRGGSFVAAPVPLPGAGILTGGSASFTMIAYDRVFNASVMQSGSFTQYGAVDPGPFDNTQDVSVQVYDSQALTPLANARVILHSDVGGGSFPYLMEGLTDITGSLTLSPGDTPLGRLVTIERAGYDLVTFHGITSNRFSIALQQTGALSVSTLTGSISSDVAAVAAILPSQSMRLDDSRRPAQANSAFGTAPCIDNGGSLSCASFGPLGVRPGRRGAASLISGNFLLTDSNFSAGTLLRSFCLNVPTDFSPAIFGSFLEFEIPFLLELADATEQPIELSSLEFRADGTTGINLGMLDVDAGTTGAPRVSVETILPGIPGSVAVGMGLSFVGALPANRWNVRSAAPGAVTAGGFFGLSNSVDTDLFIRCELRDTLGNVAGARSRLSNLAGQAPVPGALIAGNVPQLLSPVGSTGGASYDITFAETILAASNESGLYAVNILDSQGRRWTIWTPDGAGDGVRTVRVPDLSASMATPLVDGQLLLELSSFSWEALDFDAGFLWTCIEREHDQFAFSAPVPLSQP